MTRKRITITFEFEEVPDEEGFAEIFAEDLLEKRRLESKAYVVQGDELIDFDVSVENA